jgi:hypothetical protein
MALTGYDCHGRRGVTLSPPEWRMGQPARCTSRSATQEAHPSQWKRVGAAAGRICPIRSAVSSGAGPETSPGLPATLRLSKGKRIREYRRDSRSPVVTRRVISEGVRPQAGKCWSQVQGRSWYRYKPKSALANVSASSRRRPEGAPWRAKMVASEVFRPISMAPPDICSRGYVHVVQAVVLMACPAAPCGRQETDRDLRPKHVTTVFGQLRAQ